MASAPAPSASISANGSFWAPSRTPPPEPTQIAPDFSTTGSKAAASPPVMGSLGLPRATRFETTTRFTGSPPVGPSLTTIHQYGSSPTFKRIETKFGHTAWEPHAAVKRKSHSSRQLMRKTTAFAPGMEKNAALIMAAPRPFHHRADAQEIPAHRSVH